MKEVIRDTTYQIKRSFRMPALAGAGVTALSLFMPYASDDNGSFNVLRLLSGSGVLPVFAGLLLVGGLGCFAMALVNAFKPSYALSRVQVAFAVLTAVISSLLLFGSKALLEGSGLVSGFMVKDFGFGFWLMLLSSYVSLVLSMNFAKISAGYIVLTWLSIIWLFPIVWIILTAFRAESGYYVGYFIPKGFTLDNFTKLFSRTSVVPFGKWWLNTFIVAIFSCIFTTTIILMTSYVLSRCRFSWRQPLMRVMLVIGMFPGFMSMIAVYNILKGLGLTQSLAALVIVNVAGAAMGYYICKGFMDTISKSLDEAAIIDGATRLQIFTRITIPLARPIIIYTILTSFMGPWGDYIFPSMLLGDKQESYTVAIGLKWMTDFRRIDAYYTQFAAGAVLVSIPIVILFIALQKFYVEGLSGAVKG
ncbi:sugar ABC transporter permease [Butyrivibrio sp. MC2013]|uniref:sugar ABC transporter permease n=1 Tax=Butyrivibrio sp. MC2013 TaxID=1280686 RepID=UPI0003FADB84|nr:sugar ABC transporter permease [Butyrivibrio sp. MC2013]